MSNQPKIIVTTEADLRQIIAEEVRTALRRSQPAASPVPSDDGLFTRKDAATMLGVSLSTLDGMVRDGLFQKVRVGARSVRLYEAEVRKFGRIAS